MSNVNSPVVAPRARLGWKLGLWSVQILLCLFFGAAGLCKLFLSPESLVQMGANYATDVPHWLLLFIGVAETAGAIGIVLPALTRIEPSLTPLAAHGFVTLQVLAICFHLIRGEIHDLPLNFVLVALAAFVLWGRTKKAPVQGRW
ncbi:DoxX family protein [Bradyrhizobium manausense]|uniref:DoxX family protein n=1 Tax=Bradyrhizobium manausense TaxID=989370 RepID=UPI001BA5C463|nr:DoxX family protein [Bradyrhizobium manausense]MBR0834246.1 DoxX family protein [Bradyrhizobium manausense]